MTLPHDDPERSGALRDYAFAALDNADDLVVRAPEDLRIGVRASVWCVAAITYALADIAAAIREVGKAKKR